MKRILTLLLFCLTAAAAPAQQANLTRRFAPLADSLTVWLARRTTVQDINPVTVSRVLRRGSEVDFYFSASLGDFPWHEEDIRWLKAQVDEALQQLSPDDIQGRLFAGNLDVEALITPRRGDSGKKIAYPLAIDDPGRDAKMVRRLGERSFRQGLDGRTIALWQSHGMYYNADQDLWTWQRARVHRTSEDLFTQSFVLPFLIPMLENAGAYVMTPRERDTHRLEYIIDNDRSFSGERSGTLRRSGQYSEKGNWRNAGEGFADFKRSYTISDNPFQAGTARAADCTTGAATSEVRWTPDIEERGTYAVYVSYKSLPASTRSARYSVHHLGGVSQFEVNQRRGGGTWIYLGSFEFDRGEKGYVSLSNAGRAGEIVTADAVKIGGGEGKVVRGTPGGEYRTSGMPSYLEGASYWLQWAGMDSTLIFERETDYINDYTSRADWVDHLRGERDVPFDLSLAFHSDAGTTPGDSIVGTLAIYTLLSEGKRMYPNGAYRDVSRLYAEFVQDQVVSDIRALFHPDWSRRMLWNRSYYESRATGVPGIILETMSHQNLADMILGHDPAFKFTLSRSVYKGILKFLSALYGTSYIVQPLPVQDMAVRFNGNDRAVLTWTPSRDELEPTASPTGYKVFQRVDDGAFDEGREVSGCSAEFPIEPGHIYSYKVLAYNDGGYAFPSEILSIGMPEHPASQPVLVVNNFTRISAPAWFDTPAYAGFDAATDSGVPYMQDISLIGENYENRRSKEWVSDDYAGWGSSYDDQAGLIIAGNRFDNIYPHGRVLMQAGSPFYSLSRSAFERDGDQAWALDLVCGKQVTTPRGTTGEVAYEVFPATLRQRLRGFTQAGGHILITGSKIATDAWSEVYPVCPDSLHHDQVAEFVQTVLGYTLVSDHGTNTGRLAPTPAIGLGQAAFYQTPNPESYCVEHPDAIGAAGKASRIFLRYDRTRLPAGIQYDGNGYRVTAVGLPLECLKEESDRLIILRCALDYFKAP